MNKLTIFKICFLFSFFFTVISITTIYLSKFYNTHKRYTTFIDPILNLSNIQELNQLDESFFVKPATQTYQELNQKNKFLKEVKKLKGPLGIKLIFNAARPLYKICDSCILTDEGSILPSNFYLQESINNLENIEVSSLSEIQDNSSNFIKCILSLNKKILEQYKICWLNKTEILLIDKCSDDFCIKTDYKLIHDTDLLNKAEKLKEQYCNKKLKRNLWCADVRFKKQIIMHEHQKL